MKPKPTKRKVIQTSNRWTKLTKTPVPISPLQIKPQKTRFSLGVNAARFLFGTESMACYTKNDKEPRDEDTTVYSEIQSMYHQQRKKHNKCKPMPMMRHRIWLKIQTPNNDKQAVLPHRMKEGNRHGQPLNKVIQKTTGYIIKLFLNKNKPKRIQNTRRSPSPKESGTNTNKLGHKGHLRTLRKQVTINNQPLSYRAW